MSKAHSSRPPGTPADIARATMSGPPAAATILGGRYHIKRAIEEDVCGHVYLAFDSRLRRNVVIKELLAARTDAEGYLERFLRAARGGSITHPNIVAVHELAVDADNNHYLVMEYVDGTDLRAVLARVGALPVEITVALAIEIAGALDVIHDADIVHRDLRPANIMLTRQGNAKVTDFSVAQVGSDRHRAALAVGHPGTPGYMSPEQRQSTEYLDGRSDLYSLGLILYEMLGGEAYWRRRTPLAERGGMLPPRLVAIVDQLLAMDPQERYQSAAALLDDLRRIPVVLPVSWSPLDVQAGIPRTTAGLSGGAIPPDTMPDSDSSQPSVPPFPRETEHAIAEALCRDRLFLGLGGMVAFVTLALPRPADVEAQELAAFLQRFADLRGIVRPASRAIESRRPPAETPAPAPQPAPGRPRWRRLLRREMSAREGTPAPPEPRTGASPESQRPWFVDRDGGEKGVLFTIGPIRRVSDSEAEVEATWIVAPQAGQSHVYPARKTATGWTFGQPRLSAII